MAADSPNRPTRTPEQGALLIVDDAGTPFDWPPMQAALLPLVEELLLPLPGLQLPVVLKVPKGGGAWLYAYANEKRALRAHIDAEVLHKLARPGGVERGRQLLRHVVDDLAANFRSRGGANPRLFRPATRPLTTIPPPSRRTSRKPDAE